MELLVFLLAGGVLLVLRAAGRRRERPGNIPPPHHAPPPPLDLTRGPRPPLNRDPRQGARPPSEVALPEGNVILGRAWVIDGDTIKIGATKIRLAGIDAPELTDPFGQKSKWEMVALCKGMEIRAELTGERSYDRLVATCYLPDGTDIGAELIRRGLALDGGWFSQGKYRHLEPRGIRWKLRHAYLRKHGKGGA